VRYSAEQVEDMRREHEALANRLAALMMTALRVRQGLANNEAKNHLAHGVARRLKLIARCIEQLFLLLPPDAEKPIESDKLTDININLHALLVNVAGLLDDLAWVFAYESAEAAKFEADPFSVGLFKKQLQAVLPQKLVEHVSGDTFSTWHRDYAKNYRDAVAHHIPPYVAERTYSVEDGRAFEELDKAHNALLLAPHFDHVEAERLRVAQDALGLPALLMTHALSGKNRANPILFHAQAICDGLTIAELLDIALRELKVMLEPKAEIRRFPQAI